MTPALQCACIFPIQPEWWNGRHAGLKIPCRQRHESSTLSSGIEQNNDLRDTLPLHFAHLIAQYAICMAFLVSVCRDRACCSLEVGAVDHGVAAEYLRRGRFHTRGAGWPPLGSGGGGVLATPRPARHLGTMTDKKAPAKWVVALFALAAVFSGVVLIRDAVGGRDFEFVTAGSAILLAVVAVVLWRRVSKAGKAE